MTAIEIKTVNLTDPGVLAGRVSFNYAGVIDQDKLLDALRAQGVPPSKFPARPKDNKSLQRAMLSIKSRKDRVEALKPNGWVLTITKQDRLDLEDPKNTGTDAHEVSVTAKVEKTADCTTLRIIPNDHPAGALLRNEFDYQRGIFHRQDLSVWLTQTVIPWVNGVVAAGRGGSYYVTRGTNLDNFIKVKTALESVSTYQNRLIPFKEAETDPGITVNSVVQGVLVHVEPQVAEVAAVKTLIMNLIADCDKVSDEMYDTLTHGVAGKPAGKRALKTQLNKALDAEKKLRDYCSLLGLDESSLNTKLKARKDEVQAGISIAELALEKN